MVLINSLKFWLLLVVYFTAKARIIDMFPFSNEMDMLRLRLHEHDDFVDYFVILECNASNSGQSKPFYFNQSGRQMFPSFLHKIVHIMVTNPPLNIVQLQTSWRRRAVRQFFATFQFQRKDIVLYSDCDEIFRKSAVLSTLPLNSRTHFEFRQYQYNWRCCMEFNWTMPLAVNARYAQRTMSPDFIEFDRRDRPRQHKRLERNAGWHITWFLPDDRSFILKMENAGHRDDPQMQFALALPPDERARRVHECKSLWDGIPKTKFWYRIRQENMRRLRVSPIGWKISHYSCDTPRFAHLVPGFPMLNGTSDLN